MAENAAFSKLKKDISNGTLGQLYILYGEETYLREYYLDAMKKSVLEGGSSDFNLRVIHSSATADDVDKMDEITEAVEAYPSFAPRSFVDVHDFDLYKCSEDATKKLLALLEDLPEYCCLVFNYDTIEYKPDRRRKKLCAALDAHASAVEIKMQENSSLIPWIIRRFRHEGHEISREDAEYLIFLCGGLMTGLIGEIAKISSYCTQTVVARAEIDAVAVPVPDAVAFQMLRHMVRGDFRAASNTLYQLFEMREQSPKTLGAVSSQVRNLYAARLLCENGRGRDFAGLRKLMNLHNDLQVKEAFELARRVSLHWCTNALRVCCETDYRIKSSGMDDLELMTELIIRMMGEGAA